MKPARKGTQNSAKTASGTSRKSKGFTDEERAAMKECLQDRQGVHPKAGADGETLVLEKIAKMSEPDRSMAKRVHAVIKAAAPSLAPRTWYGMPAYALPGKEGKIVCFFQDAAKFKVRYATLGFSDKAKLDEGNMWPAAYALKGLTAAEEARIAALVKKAVS
ncbi:MAG TPA: hypothetical protein VIW22_02840 [Nitrososphaerales archaeon]